jgi:hypothetical protein
VLGLVAPIIPRAIVKDGDYPHMAKRDAAVWERWIEKHGANYRAVAYDVALGGLAAPGAEPDDALDRMWQYQTALKIDAFVLGDGQALVIEVRPWATVSALGAALAYSMVLDRIGVGNVALVPTIVCEGIQVDVRWCCDRLNVQVFEV